MAKLVTITLGGDRNCDGLQGEDLELYKCIIKCLKQRSGDEVMQGRVVLVFESKGKAKRGKKKKA